MSKDFGGVIRVRLSGGDFLSIRGSFSKSTARMSAAHETNQDGTLDRIFTPTSPRMEMTIARGQVDPADLMTAPRQPVSIVEDHTGVLHVMTNAFFEGDPSENRLTGEITGLTLVGEDYQEIANG